MVVGFFIVIAIVCFCTIGIAILSRDVAGIFITIVFFCAIGIAVFSKDPDHLGRFLILSFLALIGYIYIMHKLQRKKIETSMQRITSSLGLSYRRRGKVRLRENEDLSRGQFYWRFLSHFIPSENMTVAEDILSGIYKGHEVMACVVHGVDNDVYTYFKLNHQKGCPRLVICDKRKTHKTWARWLAFGQNPLAQEFSKAFRVYSSDELFARNTCHPNMMKYLLALHNELGRNIDKVEVLAHSIYMRLEGYHVDEAETRLNQLVGIYELLPQGS